MIMGTIPAFKERIEACFNSHKDELMQNPQFMGLFQAATASRQQQGHGDRELVVEQANPSGVPG